MNLWSVVDLIQSFRANVSVPYFGRTHLESGKQKYYFIKSIHQVCKSQIWLTSVVYDAVFYLAQYYAWHWDQVILFLIKVKYFLMIFNCTAEYSFETLKAKSILAKETLKATTISTVLY